MLDRPRLTIGIPTYNRASTVSLNLAAVVERLPPWVEILICDNASEPPVQLDPVVLAAASARGVIIRVHRQMANLGAPANILRLFELVNTDWLLLTGDDDPVLPEQMDQISAVIGRHSNAAVIKFSSPYGAYQSEQVAATFEEVLDLGGDFNQLLFMSNYLYRKEACLPHLRFGYMMTLSAASQVALMIMASLSGGSVVFSPLTVTRARQGEPAWSPADTRLNFYLLADLPLSPSQRRRLRSKIYKSHNVFRELLDIAAIAGSKPAEAHYIMRKSQSVHRMHGQGLKRWLAVLLLLPAATSFGRALLPLLKRLYGRAKGQPYLHSFTDRHDRL